MAEDAEHYLLAEKSSDTTAKFENVKKNLLKSLKFEETSPVKKEDFFCIYEDVLKVTGVHRSERTMKKYSTLRQQLLDFQKKKKYQIYFDKINIQFLDKLTDYYYNDLGFVNNTFGKYVSSFETFMSWATNRGYNTKIDYRKFKVIKEDADIVVLTSDELQQLVNLDLSGNHRLERIRDVFCLGCYTGLRFSDLEQYNTSTFLDQWEYILS